MRRGAKPSKPKVESKRPIAPKSREREGFRVRDLEGRLAEALKREADAHEQQAATAEILRVISSSRTDVQPVFDVIVRSAVTLCDALFSTVFRYDGVLIHHAADNYPTAEMRAVLTAGYPSAPDQDHATAIAIRERRIVHIEDVLHDTTPAGSREVALALGYRTLLCVPMLSDGPPIGTVNVARREPRPFSGEQIELIRTFAAQAVIAIENVRLFNETKEALEQQTATSAILHVIASSPTDVQPVFDTIAQNVLRLCNGLTAGVFRFDGQMLHLAAVHNFEPQARQVLESAYPIPPNRENLSARAILERETVHVPALEHEPDASASRRLGRATGYRSVLAVPMLREGIPIGVISVGRAQVGSFSDRQIELVKTFADQAVIAIENVRLFTELQEKNRALTEAHAQTSEALQQQTATAEILRVVSSSPTEVQPVFDAIVRSAVQLCGGVFSIVGRFDGEYIHFGAEYNFSPEALAVYRRWFPRRAADDHLAGRAVLEQRVMNVADVTAEFRFVPGQKEQGFRSVIFVPMVRDGVSIGVIGVSRMVVGAFPEQQVKLLQTFADQAVIAIENVRLFTELQEKNHALTQAHAQVTEALEQQTATADILRVISSSPTDVQPVYDSIVERAARLCDAEVSLVARLEGEWIHVGAVYGTSVAGTDAVRRTYPMRPGAGGATARAIRDSAIAHIPDVLIDPAFTIRDAALAAGFRAVLSVPMLREGCAIGAISIGRAEAGEFSTEQVNLLRTFADQAVIAIENVRLFTELKDKNAALTEALGQQTATSEILRVISSSPTDLQPVFDMVVRNAATLCGAAFGGLHRLDSGRITLDAHYGVPEDELMILQRDVFPLAISRGSAAGRAILDREVVQIPDIREDPDFRTPRLKTMQNYRTLLAVPMIREGVPLGALALWRRDVEPFSETEIGLVRTFADQAVIAIENVRLFTELEARNGELTDTLAQQTATGEVLRAISRAQTDAQPVFDIIAESAQRLCGAGYGQVALYDGALLHMTAFHNVNPEGMDALRRRFPAPADRGSAMGRALQTRAVVQIPDVREDPAYVFKSELQTMGFQSILVVPMLRKDEPIGAIAVGRRERGAFPDEQIELLKTFADQAVIAIENVRLFKELEARTQELTRSVGELQALGEVGQAISSTLDLQTVLSTIAARATQLSGTDAGVIYEYDEQGEIFVPRATEHLEAEIVEMMLATPVRKGEGATGRLAEVQEPVQVPDILAAPAESRVRGSLVRAGYRALLAVPLVREDHLIGGLTVIRKATGEFGPDIVELLKTFATQSALAIQNARLFREIEQKSRELEAASRHKSEFLANMSHELRTPLNAVIGFSEVLTERMFGELNEKQDEYLKDIHASGQHLLSLINDILDLSKIEAGRMELEVTDFDLPMTIDNAMTLIRERAARGSVALHTTVDERLGQIHADERKIRQVLLNLLSNAIKFTPEGGRIEVGAKPVNGCIEVSVTDTGVGIAPEDQEAVFEEFRQVGTADKKVEGTGLGLALSRKFIELHGGKIWVKSQIGAGSTFTFTVPVRRGE